MDLTKYYADIIAKYPAYVTKRELCEICHICPKTAYNLEQQGEIPYTIEQNHLIRSHKIKLTDILAYLYRRECRQEADSPYICAMRTFYDKHLSPYGCTLSKERSSMRIVAATTDEEMLHTIIGAQILGGTMDYRGFSNMKGFEQFRAACRAGDVQYSNLDYGFVEQTENLMLPDCAKEPQFEKAYRLLNLSDHEFNAIRNGSLESLGEDRTRLILDKALSWAAQNYAGWDLYRHLRDELGMSNEEIGKAGFDLDEFYEVEAADSAEYEVEADYGEEL